MVLRSFSSLQSCALSPSWPCSRSFLGGNAQDVEEQRRVDYEAGIDADLMREEHHLQHRVTSISIPKSMVWGQTYDADIVIGDSAVDLVRRLHAGAKSVNLRVTSAMQATLSADPDVSVTPAPNMPELAGLSDGPTRWAWFITPQSAGTHYLTLSITADVLLPNGIVRRIPVYQSPALEIRVQHYVWLEVMHWLIVNWQLVAGSGSLGAAALWFARWLRRRQKDTAAAQNASP